MHYDFNIYNSLILAGIIQGIVFACVVAFSRKYCATSTLLLAALILEYSLNNLQYYLNNIDMILTPELYGYYLIPGQLLSGSLLYWYGLKLLYPEKPLAKKLVSWMSLPFTIGLIWGTWLKFTFHIGVDDIQEHFSAFSSVVELSSISIYLCVVVDLFLKTRKIEHETSNFGGVVVRPELKWFRNMLIVFFVVTLMWLAAALITAFMDSDWPIWEMMWIALSLIIYLLGHIGIYKFGVQEERKKLRSYTLDRSSVIVVDKQKNDHLTAFEDLLITQKYYLDPELTLDKIAIELNLSKSHLSRLINKELKTSLPDYINQLRIKEAQYYLKHADFANYTLVAIGLEAGFASKTTFNNTFKKVTGMTPSEYRNSEQADFETAMDT